MPKISSRLILLPTVFATFALYMVRTAHVDAADNECNPPKSRYLAVPLIPQETDTWCWAASAQMVKTFLFKKVHPTQNAEFSQCAAASEANAGAKCCEQGSSTLKADPMPPACDNGAWPNFHDPHFDSRHTWEPDPRPLPHSKPPLSKPLEWETIRQEIGCARRPFVFTWGDGDTGHTVVVRGYSEKKNGERKLSIYDPLPVGKGKVYGRSYDFYANPQGHWGDFYVIQYIGP